MARKPKRKSAVSKRTRPVSFRIDHVLLGHIDVVAQRLAVTRNRLVEAVLREYVVERGGNGLETAVQEAPVDEQPVSIFA